MTITMTVLNKRGEVICDRERYDLEELKRSPAWSAEEKSQMDVFYIGWDATTIFRDGTQFILSRA